MNKLIMVAYEGRILAEIGGAAKVDPGTGVHRLGYLGVGFG